MAANCCNRREGGIRGIRRKERESFKLGKRDGDKNRKAGRDREWDRR